MNIFAHTLIYIMYIVYIHIYIERERGGGSVFLSNDLFSRTFSRICPLYKHLVFSIKAGGKSLIKCTCQ